jgi:probable rRNA maturation factor
LVETLVRGRAARLVDAAVRRRVAGRLRRALRALGRGGSSATLVFTDDDEIRALNRRYRSHDRATDVLSFHLQELSGEDDPAGDGIALGDIVISVETARRRAAGKRLPNELERLAVHGLCHLFGHDHKRPAEARVMFALEARLRRAGAGARPAANGPAKNASRASRARSASRASHDRRTTSR